MCGLFQAGGVRTAQSLLTYKAFRTINAGRFTREDLSAAWRLYSAGKPGNYLTRTPTSFERFFFDNRNFAAVRKSRGGSFGETYEHLFIMQKTFDNTVPSVRRGLGNSGWNSGLLMNRELNSSLGQDANILSRRLYQGRVILGSGASFYAGYWFGSNIGAFLLEDE